MSDKLQRAIALIKAGDKEQGNELLGEVLLENPDVELAWLWRSSVVDSDRERAYCLEQVLALNPNNQAARHGLELLQGRTGMRADATEAAPGRPAAAAAGVEVSQAGAQVADAAAAVAADETVLTEYVVREVGRHVPRQDLIYELCQRSGMSWPEAEAFVLRVSDEHGREIKGRQRPLLVVVALFTLIGGVYLFYTNATYLMQVGRDPLTLALSAPYIWWHLVLLVTGAAMVVGSLLGVWQVISPSTAPPVVDLAAEGTGSDRYKSVDDVFEVGVHVGGSGHGRRRRRTRLL